MEPRVWLINNKFFLKCVESKQIVEKLEIISKSLLESGLPSADPIKTKNDDLYITEGEGTHIIVQKEGRIYNGAIHKD